MATSQYAWFHNDSRLKSTKLAAAAPVSSSIYTHSKSAAVVTIICRNLEHGSGHHTVVIT